MHIEDVLFAPGFGAFFYDDQAAIRAGASIDGFQYVGAPLTPGFLRIRMPAQSLGVGLVLSDGVVVWGDMMSVQYSGAGGRDPLFNAAEIEALSRAVIVPRLLGAELTDFRDICASVLAPADSGRLPLAAEYGVSQALLRAAAHARRATMAETLCADFNLPVVARGVPIYAQSGDARDINVDKMALKRVDILPHGLINSREKFGAGGETFREFVRFVARRVRLLGEAGYEPILHFDVYGWIGLEIGLGADEIADFIARLTDDAPGFMLQIECPADYGTRDGQISGYRAIVEALERKGSPARIVADERCNTLDDISLFAAAKAAHLVQIKMPDVGSVSDTVLAALACKAGGVGAYVGGSCVETELSAQVSVHVAVATQAEMMLAKPGMGVDEALTITGNEQARLLATLDRAARRSRA